ncbi:hypothetical protein TL16_g03816 [Triparma laevis f. inornata]|uniref:Uncharacterized protein n=1 Tax=Triparma laevis f. inornata TaxID=1714386 RepID=A0A9W7A0T6_9STRA|nr:hypothetical protein TL16_g03816 [Triparma laevis f. inornata]
MTQAHTPPLLPFLSLLYVTLYAHIAPFTSASVFTSMVLPGHSCFPRFTERLTTSSTYSAKNQGCGLNCVPNYDLPSPPYTYLENGLPPNPFCHIDVGSSAAPSFIDVDKDGDLDLVVGNEPGGNLFYENTGTSTSPKYDLLLNKDNPMFGMIVLGFSTIGVGDIDNDGDDDVYIAGLDGKPVLLENNSTRGSHPNADITPKDLVFYDRRQGLQNPLLIDKFEQGVPMNKGTYKEPIIYRMSVEMADLDGDGDGDLILSTADGHISVLKNVGKIKQNTFVVVGQIFIDQYKPMFQSVPLSSYFPQVPNPYPIKIREGYDNSILDIDTLKIVVADIDNDGKDELIVTYQGQVNMYDDMDDFRHPNQQKRLLAEYDLGDIDPHVTVADVNGDGVNDIVVGETTGHLRYFEGGGFECTSCPAGSFVPPPPDVPACRPCPAGFYSAEANMTECLITKPGFFSVDPAASPEICEPGTVNFVEASQMCFQCPSGSKACLGGTNCSSTREDPSTLCVMCKANHYKSIDDNCIECGPGSNYFESGIALIVLALTLFVASRLTPSDDGFFYAVSAFDYGQLFLLTLMLGVELGNGSVGILTIMSSLLFHVDFLHLDCWVREINFAHKLLVLYATIFLVLFSLFTRLKRGEIIAKAKKIAYFKDKKEWDDMHSGSSKNSTSLSNNNGDDFVVEDFDPDESSSNLEDNDDEDNEDDDQDGGMSKKAEMEKDFYSKHGAVAQATIGRTQTAENLLIKADFQQWGLDVRARRRMFYFYLFILQTPLIHFTLKLFDCTKMDWDGNEAMALDTRISCSNHIYTLVASAGRALVPVLVLAPPIFIVKAMVEIVEEKATWNCHSIDTYGPLFEHCGRGTLVFWEAVRLLRRGLMASFVSLNGTVVPGLQNGREGVLQKSTWVFFLNTLYLLLLILVRPYTARSYMMMDVGVTLLFVLAALINMSSASSDDSGSATSIDQTVLYLFVVASWGFVGGMAFWFRGRRLKARVDLAKMARKEERDWLAQLRPYDNEELHKKSKALLNDFISKASNASAAGRMEDFVTARQLHVENTRIQAKLIKSLEQYSGLRLFVSQQFPTKEHVFEKDLRASTKFYRKHLEELQYDSDHKSFQLFLRVCIKTYDSNVMHEKTLTQLHLASLHTHDFRVSMDVLNELQLYVKNGEEKSLDKWQENVRHVVGKFEVGNEEHFVNMERRLVSKISDERKRNEARNLGRQRVRELLLKKCEQTCKVLEDGFCKVAWKCALRAQVQEIYQFLQVWCDDAEGFGLPEDVEERLLRERANRGRRAGARASMIAKASEALFGKQKNGKRMTIAQRIGGAVKIAMGGRPGKKVHGYHLDPNRTSLKVPSTPKVAPAMDPSDPFAKFKRQVEERAAGLVNLEDITKKVREEIIAVQRGIHNLSQQEVVDPIEVFGVVKTSKEALDKWCTDALESLWLFELRALLRGDPVKVRVYQRTQMDIFAAKFTFIKAAQKSMDKGKDLLISDDPMTLRGK